MVRAVQAPAASVSAAPAARTAGSKPDECERAAVRAQTAPGNPGARSPAVVASVEWDDVKDFTPAEIVEALVDEALHKMKRQGGR